MVRALRSAALGLLLFARGAAAAAEQRAAVTPLQKVLQMLDDMVAKGKKEKHEEEVEFAKFHEWCDNTREETTKSIKEAASQIEQLTADIAKAEADAERLASEIADLESSIAQDESDLSEAKTLREREHADYSAIHADLSESIDAIERAISVLKTREPDVPQSLLQLRDSPRIPAEAKAAIESFLALSSDAEASPEANAYEFQSGGVVAMLEKLRHKFQDQRLVLEKEEMNAKANFEMLAQQFTDDIAEDKKRAAAKTATKAQRLDDAATAKGDLESTQATKAEDEKKLEDTLTSCHARSVEFEENQVLRAEEVKAIEQASEILRSDEVSGNADTYLPSFVQVRRSTSLAQLRGGETPEVSQRRQRLTSFLESAARKTGSRYLALMASHASADPFAKVKKMIKDLIVKLMEQANKEADHKSYCDAELATNKQTREIKQSEVEELTASIEKNTAESTQLAEEIAELSEAMAQLRKEQAEATEIRQKEKATNTQTIADAKAAQLAVQRATKILKDFYAKASGDALLQSGAHMGEQMAQAANAPYKGMQAESGGIVGFLEVVLSDFARLEAETSSAEDQAAEAYEKFMDESNEDIAVKTTATKHKTSKKEQTEGTIASEKKELDLTQQELDAALAYFDKLKPECLDKGLSYEERVRMREEEVQSLKEALEILNQQDLA